MRRGTYRFPAHAAIAFAGVFATTGTWASAASHTILEYSFPISWNGSGVAADLSPAGNNGIVSGSPAVAAALPSGGIGKSLTTNSGGLLTSAATESQLLLNNYVANNGGFSFEAWFRWDGTANASWPTQKIIDYAGTESLQLFNPSGAHQTANEKVQFAFNSATDAANAVSISISANVWYHAIATFNSSGHSIDGSGSLAGVASLSIDSGSGPTTATLNVTKTNQGDGLNRPIGVGVLGLSGNNVVNFDGQIYQPTVSLGVIPGAPDGLAGVDVVAPEPASLGLAACLGGPLLLARRRRHRQIA